MAIYVKGTNDYPVAPEGQHLAVCCDVLELHDVPTQYGPKTKVRIYFQLEAVQEDGRPFVAARTFGATLSELGALRPFLESWRGSRFTSEELERFDLEVLIGVNAVIQLIHVERDGKTYANVNSIMRPAKGTSLLAIDPKYIRMQDRRGDDYVAPRADDPSVMVAPTPEEQYGELPEPEDDLPF